MLQNPEFSSTRYFGDVGSPDYALLDTGLIMGPDAAGFFDDIGKAFSDVVKPIGDVVNVVAKPIEAIAKPFVDPVLQVVKPVASVLTNNPLFDIVKTGASFIPGVGTAVSSGLSALSAIGKGASLGDIALEAAKGAIPGGAVTRAALDTAIGAIQGKNLGDSALSAIRQQLPGGELAKAAFDAGSVIAKGFVNDVNKLTEHRSKIPTAAGKKAFDEAINAYKRGNAPPMVNFPSLSGSHKTTARKMQTMGRRALRTPARTIAKHAGVGTNEVRSVMSSFLNRWAGAPVTQMTSVGEADSLEDAAALHNIPVGYADFEPAPGGDAGEMTFEKVQKVGQPKVAMTLPTSFLQALYDKGPTNVRKAILAHGLIARTYQSTGELDSATGKWVLKAGDTGWKVAQKLTGDGNRWKELPAVNPGMKVTGSGTNQQLVPWAPGQKVTLPPSWLGTATPSSAPALPGVPAVVIPANLPVPLPMPSSSSSTYYTVVSGDSLSKIAAKFTGTSSRWTELYSIAENRKTIGSDPNKIQVGQKLRLPNSWVASPSAPSLPSVIPGELPSLPPSLPIPSGPAVPNSSGIPTIGALQAMLAFFFNRHGSEIPGGLFSSSSVPTFGTDPDDLKGEWDDRCVEATIGFQTWWNAHALTGDLSMGSPLATDGVMDQTTAAALQAQNKRDLANLGQSVPGPSTPVIPSIPVPNLPGIIPAVTPGSSGTSPKPPATVPQSTQASTSKDSGGMLLLALAAAAVFALGGSGR